MKRSPYRNIKMFIQLSGNGCDMQAFDDKAGKK
jgi:hypothetical protein